MSNRYTLELDLRSAAEEVSDGDTGGSRVAITDRDQFLAADRAGDFAEVLKQLSISLRILGRA